MTSKQILKMALATSESEDIKFRTKVNQQAFKAPANGTLLGNTHRNIIAGAAQNQLLNRATKLQQAMPNMK